ncbi:MAG: radical SAM protein, partial [Anaerolineae bacterium]|nr:radical SAM protein [Anaerolineae bacterium]
MPTTTETIPTRLSAIYEEVNHFQPEKSNLSLLRQAWETHVSRARQQITGLHVEADGEILYLGDLSPGCRACKEGAWDCIFVTMECNLNCPFCYSPHAIPRDYAGSTFGATPAEIAENQARTRITGVSFSGGEPFLNPQRLFDWLAWFKGRYPDKYYWLYTNGLLADQAFLQRLEELGLDELRFNLAATGYDHPPVMENVATAARFIPNITVEIPAIPGHAAKLLSCLVKWSEAGVKFLNLHELMYEPGTNAASMVGERQPVV